MIFSDRINLIWVVRTVDHYAGAMYGTIGELDLLFRWELAMLWYGLIFSGIEGLKLQFCTPIKLRKPITPLWRNTLFLLSCITCELIFFIEFKHENATINSKKVHRGLAFLWI